MFCEKGCNAFVKEKKKKDLNRKPNDRCLLLIMKHSHKSMEISKNTLSLLYYFFHTIFDAQDAINRLQTNLKCQPWSLSLKDSQFV